MSGLVVDSFAGGGGASLGIAWALGRAPDVAINHDPLAIAMHAANHPSTRHLTEDVWKANPRAVTRGKPVSLLWASPDCKHFSRAKGSRPVEKRIRSLAWVVVRWAKETRPACIILENVREFAEWGPLVPLHACRECEWRGTEGQARLGSPRGGFSCPRCGARRLRQTDRHVPDERRKGITFRRWVGQLKNLGYQVEWRSLNAADFGAPTHRRRLFLVARCDGAPIVWPEPTHGDPRKLDATPLFARLKPWRTAAECIDFSLPCPSIFERSRPLKEATMRRIAEGIRRYVLEAAEPFIVGVGGRAAQSPPTPLSSPLGTVTGKNDQALVLPFVVPITHAGRRRPHSLGEPLLTVTSARRGEFALIAPTLIQIGYGERAGQAPRVPGLDKPLGAAVAGGCKHALVAAFLSRHFGGSVGTELGGPSPTETARAHSSLIVANLIHLNHGGKTWNDVREPLRTVTTAPHAALVYSFLVRYFGTAIGQNVTEPLYTITGKDRFGLVLVQVGGQPFAIVDIGMRMLTPRELARAQGFPDTYLLNGTKTSQVARIGSSVCPVMARVLVESNLCSQPSGVLLNAGGSEHV